MTTSYQTLAEFRDLTVLPADYVDAVEAVHPGWILNQLQDKSRWIDSRLRKRYDVPFETPPQTVKSWLTRLVTLKVWIRRGVDPTDAQFDEVKKDHDEAIAEIREAADSNTGLFDVPLKDSEKTSGATLGAPRSYSEQSPYVFTNGQYTTGRNEDNNGRGSNG